MDISKAKAYDEQGAIRLIAKAVSITGVALVAKQIGITRQSVYNGLRGKSPAMVCLMLNYIHGRHRRFHDIQDAKGNNYYISLG